MRPTKYTQELADEICGQLADGDSMRTVCKPDNMPCKATVFSWLRTNKEFLDQYVLAKQESADALTDEMLDIADDGTNDWQPILKDGEDEPIGWKLNSENIQRSRLRIDTRKWLASKLKPKKYGDKLEVEGAEPIKVIELQTQFFEDDEIKKMSDSALKELAARGIKS